MTAEGMKFRRIRQHSPKQLQDDALVVGEGGDFVGAP
jgi:hypothetical protein